MLNVKVKDSPIRLDQFLKYCGIFKSGGEAKINIIRGNVRVNGEVSTFRSKKLNSNDLIEINGKQIIVEYEGS